MGVVGKIRALLAKLTGGSEHDLSRRFPGAVFLCPENIELGDRVAIAGGAILSADSPISVGNDTLIAGRAIINTATHDYSNNPIWKQRISRPISIGRHVWIGSGAIVLPGVKIGDYAVVGAGSVVTLHVPEKAVVAGNPARIIRRREAGPVDESCAYPGVAVVEDFLPDSRITPDADGDKRE